MARRTESDQIDVSAIMLHMVDVRHGQSFLVGAEWLSRLAALLPAVLALPANSVLQLGRDLIPIGWVFIAVHWHG